MPKIFNLLSYSALTHATGIQGQDLSSIPLALRLYLLIIAARIFHFDLLERFDLT